MVGKVSERVLLREGLERTDNGMKQTSWPDVAPINQKNYYTDYMKRDDQILSYRLQAEANRDRLVQNAKDRDRALNNNNGEIPLPLDMMPGDDGSSQSSSFSEPSKIIVIHPGSQNLRLGFATDALPKTIPMVLATKYPQTESDMYEPLPRRQFENPDPKHQYDEEWVKKYEKMSKDLMATMRANKLKVPPTPKELVYNFNRRRGEEPEVISQHNDPLQVEWTDVKTLEDTDSAASVFIGQQALRVPDDSDPKFKLWWPLQHGQLNEDDYPTKAHLFNDLETVLDRAIRWELGLKRSSEWKQYSCIFVIPDLYDKKYVEEILHICIEWFEFSKVSFIQESIAASFGAGYTQACVVDVGAQKTSITCVEDGLVMEDSRVNLKYGGYDVTESFIKMMLVSKFPYKDINLRRRYDFLLAEELKAKYCTMNQASIATVTPVDFHVRAPNQPTYKYQFRYYDEVMLACMGFYDPSVYDNSTKNRGRRKLVDRSYNAYDVEIPDDPTSAAQLAILALTQPSVTATTVSFTGAPPDMATPSKERSHPFNFLARADATPGTSKAPSPAPEGASTPVPPPYIFGSSRDNINGAASPAPSGRNGGTPAPPNNPLAGINGTSTLPPPGIPIESLQRTPKDLAEERDSVLPVAPLDIAIMTSIQNAAKGDEKKVKELLGSIMVIGGGAKIPHFAPYLEEKLKTRRPDLAEKILVSRSAREMDEQVVVWKGASVFAKLPTNDSWITAYEYKMLRSRAIYHKALWQY